MTAPQRLMIDGHLDLAMNALYINRDLRMSAHEIRELEVGQSGFGRAAGTIGFPDLRAGNIGLSFVTVIARARTRTRKLIPLSTSAPKRLPTPRPRVNSPGIANMPASAISGSFEIRTI